jgi:uncharacterized protein (DUF2267 family)
MSQPGLEALETSFQKTHEWIAEVSEAANVDKATAYKALRAILHGLRDRLPVMESVHLAAQLPLLLRGVYYEGWMPEAVPIKYSRAGFLHEIAPHLSTKHALDPAEICGVVFMVLNRRLSPGEITKVRGILPEDLRSLWPEPPQT